MGHFSTALDKPISEYTHNWIVYVRSNENVHKFIKKVVFDLNAGHCHSRREFTRPPYQVQELGNMEFSFPIEIHLRNDEEPKQITFKYDLMLPSVTTSTLSFNRSETLTFIGPSNAFLNNLLQGGATSCSFATRPPLTTLMQMNLRAMSAAYSHQTLEAPQQVSADSAPLQLAHSRPGSARKASSDDSCDIDVVGLGSPVRRNSSSSIDTGTWSESRCKHCSVCALMENMQAAAKLGHNADVQTSETLLKAFCSTAVTEDYNISSKVEQHRDIICIDDSDDDNDCCNNKIPRQYNLSNSTCLHSAYVAATNVQSSENLSCADIIDEQMSAMTSALSADKVVLQGLNNFLSNKSPVMSPLSKIRSNCTGTESVSDRFVIDACSLQHSQCTCSNCENDNGALNSVSSRHLSLTKRSHSSSPALKICYPQRLSQFSERSANSDYNSTSNVSAHLSQSVKTEKMVIQNCNIEKAKLDIELAVGSALHANATSCIRDANLSAVNRSRLSHMFADQSQLSINFSAVPSIAVAATSRVKRCIEEKPARKRKKKQTLDTLEKSLQQNQNLVLDGRIPQASTMDGRQDHCRRVLPMLYTGRQFLSFNRSDVRSDSKLHGSLPRKSEDLSSSALKREVAVEEVKTGERPFRVQQCTLPLKAESSSGSLLHDAQDNQSYLNALEDFKPCKSSKSKKSSLKKLQIKMPFTSSRVSGTLLPSSPLEVNHLLNPINTVETFNCSDKSTSNKSRTKRKGSASSEHYSSSLADNSNILVIKRSKKSSNSGKQKDKKKKHWRTGDDSNAKPAIINNHQLTGMLGVDAIQPRVVLERLDVKLLRKYTRQVPVKHSLANQESSDHSKPRTVLDHTSLSLPRSELLESECSSLLNNTLDIKDNDNNVCTSVTDGAFVGNTCNDNAVSKVESIEEYGNSQLMVVSASTLEDKQLDLVNGVEATDAATPDHKLSGDSTCPGLVISSVCGNFDWKFWDTKLPPLINLLELPKTSEMVESETEISSDNCSCNGTVNASITNNATEFVNALEINNDTNFMNTLEKNSGSDIVNMPVANCDDIVNTQAVCNVMSVPATNSDINFVSVPAINDSASTEVDQEVSIASKDNISATDQPEISTDFRENGVLFIENTCSAADEQSTESVHSFQDDSVALSDCSEMVMPNADDGEGQSLELNNTATRSESSETAIGDYAATETTKTDYQTTATNDLDISVNFEVKADSVQTCNQPQTVKPAERGEFTLSKLWHMLDNIPELMTVNNTSCGSIVEAERTSKSLDHAKMAVEVGERQTMYQQNEGRIETKTNYRSLIIGDFSDRYAFTDGDDEEVLAINKTLTVEEQNCLDIIFADNSEVEVAAREKTHMLHCKPVDSANSHNSVTVCTTLDTSSCEDVFAVTLTGMDEPQCISSHAFAHSHNNALLSTELEHMSQHSAVNDDCINSEQHERVFTTSNISALTSCWSPILVDALPLAETTDNDRSASSRQLRRTTSTDCSELSAAVSNETYTSGDIQEDVSVLLNVTAGRLLQENTDVIDSTLDNASRENETFEAEHARGEEDEMSEEESEADLEENDFIKEGEILDRGEISRVNTLAEALVEASEEDLLLSLQQACEKLCAQSNIEASKVDEPISSSMIAGKGFDRDVTAEQWLFSHQQNYTQVNYINASEIYGAHIVENTHLSEASCISEADYNMDRRGVKSASVAASSREEGLTLNSTVQECGIKSDDTRVCVNVSDVSVTEVISCADVVCMQAESIRNSNEVIAEDRQCEDIGTNMAELNEEACVLPNGCVAPEIEKCEMGTTDLAENDTVGTTEMTGEGSVSEGNCEQNCSADEEVSVLRSNPNGAAPVLGEACMELPNYKKTHSSMKLVDDCEVEVLKADNNVPETIKEMTAAECHEKEMTAAECHEKVVDYNEDHSRLANIGESSITDNTPHIKLDTTPFSMTDDSSSGNSSSGNSSSGESSSSESSSGESSSDESSLDDTSSDESSSSASEALQVEGNNPDLSFDSQENLLSLFRSDEAHAVECDKEKYCGSENNATTTLVDETEAGEENSFNNGCSREIVKQGDTLIETMPINSLPLRDDQKREHRTSYSDCELLNVCDIDFSPAITTIRKCEYESNMQHNILPDKINANQVTDKATTDNSTCLLQHSDVTSTLRSPLSVLSQEPDCNLSSPDKKLSYDTLESYSDFDDDDNDDDEHGERDSNGASRAPNGMQYSSLIQLQMSLMTSRNTTVLNDIVNIIQNTGMFELTSDSFDFDLCTLDRRIVRRIQRLLGAPHRPLLSPLRH